MDVTSSPFKKRHARLVETDFCKSAKNFVILHEIIAKVISLCLILSDYDCGRLRLYLFTSSLKGSVFSHLHKNVAAVLTHLWLL